MNIELQIKKKKNCLGFLQSFFFSIFYFIYANHKKEGHRQISSFCCFFFSFAIKHVQ